MSGGGARVSIPGNVRKVIGEIKLVTAGKFNDEFINSLLKECAMDSSEVIQRLKMIKDITEIAKKHSNEDVHIMLKECNMDPNEAAQRLLYIDTFREVKKKRDKRNMNMNNGAYEDYRRAPGKQWQGARGGQGNHYPSNDVGGRTVSSLKENGGRIRNRTERVPGSTSPVQNNEENNVSLQMASSSAVHFNGPAMTPVVVPSPYTQNAGVVGTKKGEADKQSGIAEAVSTPIVNTSVDDGSSLNETLKVVASEPVTVTVAVSDSIIGRESVIEDSNPKLEMKLEKLTISTNLPVTFPDHLQVPETFKKQLTFGSLDAALGDKNSSISSIESVQGNDVMDASIVSSQNVTSSVGEDEFPSHPLPPPNVPERALPSEDSAPSDSSQTQEESMQEAVLSQGVSQFPFTHPTTNYGFGLPPQPHYLGILPPEVFQHQMQSGSSLVSSASSTATQSSGAAQTSLSPPPFPLFQQPFSHGYFPYGPYFPPQYYWPPNAHHLMAHGGFPLHPFVIPPGMKFPLPSPYVQGANAGHSAHFGIPTAYGTYPAGYTADAAPASADNKEDNVESQTKEKSTNPAKSPAQQGEDAHVGAIAPSREMPSMPNYFYNLPQGHHMTFSPAIYHHYPSQTVAAQSTIQPPLHQSEPKEAGSLEASSGPPSDSYE